ncbi:hypothetical protein, partial [Psychromonas aquatilis]
MIVNGALLLNKQNGSIKYGDSVLPSLDKYKSLIYQLRDDTQLAEIHDSLDSIVIIDSNSRSYSQPNAIPVLNKSINKRIIKELKGNDLSILEITGKYKDLNCREKLYYAYQYDKSKFEDFLFTYTTIFPDVETYSGLIEPDTLILDNNIHY